MPNKHKDPGTSKSKTLGTEAIDSSTTQDPIARHAQAEVHAPPQPLSATAAKRSVRSSQTMMDLSPPTTSTPSEEARFSRAERGTSTTLAPQGPEGLDERESGGKYENTDQGHARVHRPGADVQITLDGHEFTFPDGGTEAWLCLLGGFLGFFCSFGIVSATGAFQTYYEDNLLSQYPSTIAWIGSLSAFISLGLAPVIGSFFDLYGHKPLIGAGTFILVLSYSLLSLSTQYYQVLLCHTLSGAGIPLLFISSVGVTGQWFSKRRGLAFGILTSGGSVGGAVWPILWANLPPEIGFPWTMRLIALILGILGTSAFFLMKTRLPPKPPGPFFYPKAFRSLVYICLCVGASSWASGFFTSLTFVGTYGRLLELGDVTPYLLVTVNGASGIGRLLTACIADRAGAYNMTIIGNIIMVILFYSWLAARTGTSLIVINVLYGIASGPYISLQAPMITRLADDMRCAGTMVGQVMMFQSVSQLIGPPIAGALFGHGSREEQLDNFPRLIIFGSLLLTVSTVAIVIARFKLDRSWRVVI